MMRWIAGAILGVIGVIGLWLAPAGAVGFDLTNCAQAGLPATCNNQSAGVSSVDFTAGPFQLGVSGFRGILPNDLFLKLGAPNETGLGLFGTTPANEVAEGDSEVFNFGLLAAIGLHNGTMEVSSLQEGEVGLVSFDSTSVAAVEVDHTGISAPIPFTFSLLEPTVTLTALSGDVLAAVAIEVPVPEPTPWLLMATGLVGLGGFALRRRMMPR